MIDLIFAIITLLILLSITIMPFIIFHLSNKKFKE